MKRVTACGCAYDTEKDGVWWCPMHLAAEETEKKLKAAHHVIGLVDKALEGVRLVGGDQNPLGWRDVLGAAASKIRKGK